MTDSWLALMIGNSRLHWAWFRDRTCQAWWQTPHLTATDRQHLVDHNFRSAAWVGLSDRLVPAAFDQTAASRALPLWLATVVPEQADLWRSQLGLHLIHPQQLPLTGLYDSLGHDRILALWALRSRYGGAGLAIDGGTALTVSGLDAAATFQGGAILPGLRLQFQALGQGTAALPALDLPETIPARWATTTTTAIQSGIIHTVLDGVQGFVQAWCDRHPQSTVVLTGGDGAWLFAHLSPRLAGVNLVLNPHLVLDGICAYRDWSHTSSCAINSGD